MSRPGRIIGGAKSDHLSVNPRPAAAGVLELFENHETAAFGDNRAVALRAERAAVPA